MREESNPKLPIDFHHDRFTQLDRAVRKLAPHTCFWYKDQSTTEELVQIVSDYDYPVGIEF